MTCVSCVYDTRDSVDNYVETGDFLGISPRFYKKYDTKMWKSQKIIFLVDEKRLKQSIAKIVTNSRQFPLRFDWGPCRGV
jgi:hypothetical protein